MTGPDFGKWLDNEGISVAEASAYFGVSEKTIYQWRSTSGIPDRKLEWVQTQMSTYARKTSQASELDRLVLEITDEQFSAWNDAACGAGLRLKDWCITTLDAACQDSTGLDATPNPVYPPLMKVAEPDAEYLPKKGNGA